MSAMKIDENLPVTTVSTVKGEAASELSEMRRLGPGTGKGEGDTVELSRSAERLAKASRALQNIPDIRADRVEELKARLSSGEYSVKASDVAEKMLMQLKRGGAA